MTTDACSAFTEEWTWQILLVAFFVAAVAGILFIVIIFCVCGSRGRGTVGLHDSNEMGQQNTAVSPRDTPQINRQNDSNKTEAVTLTYENVEPEKPTVPADLYATVNKTGTNKGQGQTNNPNDSNRTEAREDTEENPAHMYSDARSAF